MGKDLTGKELGKGITQRKDGTYMARYVDRYRKRRTFYDKNLKMLKIKLEKEKYNSKYGMTIENGMTLQEWFKEFMSLYKKGRVKNTTLYRIHQTFTPCKKHSIGMMKLADIRGIHIQKLFNELSVKGYSYGTLNLLKSLLNEMFKKAIGNGLALINPCNSVVMPKNEHKESRYLTEKEQEIFLKNAKDYVHYEIFLADLSSGLRIGELLGLKWQDINFEDKTINIQRTLHYSRLNDNETCHFFFTTPKTGTSIRKMPLLPETEAVLKSVRDKQIENKILYANKWKQEDPFIDMVFTTQFGKPIRYGDVNRTIKTVVNKANMIEVEIAKREHREPYLLKPFSPHCFRHTFVTRCKKHGISYETIQPYVGHSNKEMTEYYDHNTPELDIEGLNKISFL